MSQSTSIIVLQPNLGMNMVTLVLCSISTTLSVLQTRLWSWALQSFFHRGNVGMEQANLYMHASVLVARKCTAQQLHLIRTSVKQARVSALPSLMRIWEFRAVTWVEWLYPSWQVMTWLIINVFLNRETRQAVLRLHIGNSYIARLNLTLSI